MSDKYELSRRKALAALGTIGVAGAGAGMGTSALFSDEENFNGNTLVAGELNLLVDYWTSQNTNTSSAAIDDGQANNDTIQGDVSAEYVLGDVKPGDGGFLVFCPKIVDNEAYLWAGSSGLTDFENGYTEPELDVDPDADDSTTVDDDDPGDGEGELSEKIQITSVSYCEYDEPDGEYTGPYDNPREDPANYTGSELNNPYGDYTLADLILELQTGFRISDNEDGTYPASSGSDTQEGPCLCVEWEIPDTVGNVIQSDSVEFDIQFAAVQSRNVSDPAQENPFVDAVLESDATGGIRETDNWITAKVSAGPTTVVQVDLDGEVYGGGSSGLGEWPSNANSYFMEANIDIDNDGIDEAANDDDFRVGYAAANSGARVNAISNSQTGASGNGGYIRRNTGGTSSGDSANRTDVAEEDVPGFAAFESADQLSYTFVLDWSAIAADSAADTAELSSAPGAIQINEVFGGDGGEGVAATPNSSNDGRGSVDNVADGSGTLTL